MNMLVMLLFLLLVHTIIGVSLYFSYSVLILGNNFIVPEMFRMISGFILLSFLLGMVCSIKVKSVEDS
jgi:membrane-bound ClpP family serine protease